MKVSMDHYFSSCSGCPFVSIRSTTDEMLPYDHKDYFCRLLKIDVIPNKIHEECPLKEDEEGKIYKKYAEDIQ